MSLISGVGGRLCCIFQYKLFVSGVWQALFGSPDDDSDRAHRPLLTDRHTNTECSQENRNLEVCCAGTATIKYCATFLCFRFWVKTKQAVPETKLHVT